ncbi:hypothetical protein TanjilG_29811 [Lupinus angustifolius]|uniref:HMA domain-containing protein n=1 Tax=Lupinus angustifolius TaxID=3871 RepID=A0A4P1RAG1_LUPAN|nr:PREDICTED: heavy metal-associated isoprenylated plant protein 47-like [Lupinus angustifolius]OIW06055.1 hypothetical protein TanjilG_29811 [Lupinus angustifolius]
MKSDKCRRKAMKIAADTEGVISVSLEGENKDQVVVIGNGIDSVELSIELRKKFKHVLLASIEEAEPENDMMPMEIMSAPYNYYWKYYNKHSPSSFPPPPPPYPPSYHVVHDPYPNNDCTII